jgi:uncharacterized protein YlbG (UPF0298 family)
MKVITTANAAQVKKKDKRSLKKYWDLIYAPEYVDLMVAKKQEPELTKQASAKLKDVKLVGKIKQSPNGFVYVKMPDKIIDTFFALIDEEDIKKPPSYGPVGAHISLISEEELKDKDIEIKEVGDEINFELGDMFSTVPKNWDGIKRVWFIQVKSKELENIRKKYGLPKKINGNEFHITIAIK